MSIKHFIYANSTNRVGLNIIIGNTHNTDASLNIHLGLSVVQNSGPPILISRQQQNEPSSLLWYDSRQKHQ